MRLNTIDPGIYTVCKLLSKEECAQLIDVAEGLGFEEAAVRTSTGPRMMKSLRNNDRVVIHDSVLARLMWKRVEYLLPDIDGESPTGVDKQIRFYRYVPGQVFKRHKDGSVTNDAGERSKLSYLIYLNDEFVGGTTLFREYSAAGEGRVKNETIIRPETGLALLFRHHRWHESTSLSSGSKYVLRTDVFFSNGHSSQS